MPAPANSVNLPHDFVVAPFNDIPGTEKVLSLISPNSLAAILVEAVQGAGGAVGASLEFLQYLRRAATAHKALFVADEVMTSRLAYRGQMAKLGIDVDIMTLGKWIGGGSGGTFGAFGGKKHILAMFNQTEGGQLTHSGTFNNNNFSMAAGIIGCGLMTEGVVERLNALGNELRLQVETLLTSHSVAPSELFEATNRGRKFEGKTPVMWVQGVGSMKAFYFSGDASTSKLLKGLFFQHLLQNNIYIASRGFVSLSIEIREEHVAKFVSAVESFVLKFHSSLIGPMDTIEVAK